MGLNSYTGPDQDEKDILVRLAFKAARMDYLEQIAAVETYDQYERLMYELEEMQPAIHQMKNYNQSDITEHIKKFI
jgi:hypothetical protein